MACSTCRRNDAGGTEPAKNDSVMKTLPTDQCIACAQKHMDEAWVLYLEYGYGRENARLCRGNLRAIVLHTYKQWPKIASQARECALSLQDGKDAETQMRELCGMIDDAFDAFDARSHTTTTTSTTTSATAAQAPNIWNTR